MNTSSSRGQVNIEVRDKKGQVFLVLCEIGQEEAVRKMFSEQIEYLRIPNTKEICGWGTRYEIEQLEEPATGDGFMEVLEIKNPPDGRCGIVVFERDWRRYGTFYEFNDAASARRAFKKHRGEEDVAKNRKDIPNLRGFKRMVVCDLVKPWFYAVGNQTIVGDYVFPEEYQGDPVFTFGKKFLVFERDFDLHRKVLTGIKTCLGSFIANDPDTMRGRGQTRRMVIWDDGSLTDLMSSGLPAPRELRGDEVSIEMAMEEFRRLLSGRTEKFEISLIDGTVIVVKVSHNKQKTLRAAGNYYIKVVHDGRPSIIEDVIYFNPTVEIPDVVTHVENRLKQNGIKALSIEVWRKSTERGGDKWCGVFYSQK